MIELAAAKAGWGNGTSEGRALGIATHRYDSYVAQVADVSVAADGAIKVHRVVCAIDCGIAGDPRGVRAQVEGGILCDCGGDRQSHPGAAVQTAWALTI